MLCNDTFKRDFMESTSMLSPMFVISLQESTRQTVISLRRVQMRSVEEVSVTTERLA
jgi:hypothetical protein